jgi:hypothetical protein
MKGMIKETSVVTIRTDVLWTGLDRIISCII